MRRLELSSILAGLLAFPLGCYAQQIFREGGRWVQVFSGHAQAVPQLRVQAQGPVTLEAGVAPDVQYTAKVSVRAANEEDARKRLQQFWIRLSPQGSWGVLASAPGDFAVDLQVRASKLKAAAVTTPEGGINVSGVDGAVEAESGAGDVVVDRIRGDGRLVTHGGGIQVGELGGSLRAVTWAGPVRARSVQGEAIIRTMGGNIDLDEASGPVRAETGGGGIRIGRAGGNVEAITAGGRITVTAAKGVVTARNGAGVIQVSSAAGAQCESGAGRILLSNIAGAMRVSTNFGSIDVVLPNRTADSYFATGNGDITLTIPSNLGVTIQAENELADSPRRIISEFPQLPVRVQGPRLVASGAVNGGGPVLRVSAKAGTINIKRQ